MKNNRWLKIIGCLVLIILILIGIDSLINRKNTELLSLPHYDQLAFEELNSAFEAEGSDVFWKNFSLNDKPILLISQESHYSYLINPQKNIRSIFATPIDLPNKSQDTNLSDYRLSRSYPGLLGLRIFGGNFNTIGETTNILGNDVYYLKYNSDSFDQDYSSQHFVNFLYHEAFHYFMHNDWAGGDRFFAEFDQQDLQLLDKKLNLLDKARTVLKNSDPDLNELQTIAKEIIELEEQRMASNPEYVQNENMMETVEGTAIYVGMLASHVVGYDNGPMYFDNTKDVPFADVVPFYNEGRLEEGFLRDRLPYETGLVLSIILNELDPEGNWQAYLNEQTLENQRTLLDALKETI